MENSKKLCWCNEARWFSHSHTPCWTPGLRLSGLVSPDFQGWLVYGLNFLHVSSFIFYMFFPQWKGIFRKKNNSEPKISNSTYSRVPNSFWTSAYMLISLMGYHSQTEMDAEWRIRQLLECFDSHWSSKARTRSFKYTVVWSFAGSWVKVGDFWNDFVYYL